MDLEFVAGLEAEMGLIPGVIGVGIDLVAVARMRDVMERTPRFIERVLSVDERAYCLAQVRPEEHVAVRFAAKEAVIKVFGSGLFSVGLADIAVERNELGRPSLIVSGTAARRAEQLGVDRWLLSLTHTDEMAGAVVIAVST